MNKTMNSSALIMRPKPAFLEWMNTPGIYSLLPKEKQGFLESQSLESMRANATIISIPLLTSNADAEAEKFIELNANDMLDAEFERWCVPVHARPTELDSALLKTWFDVSCHIKIFSLE